MKGRASLYGSTPPPPPGRAPRRRRPELGSSARLGGQRRLLGGRRRLPPRRDPRCAAAGWPWRPVRQRLAFFGGLSVAFSAVGAVGARLLGRLLGVAHRAAAERAPHGRALHEHPADVRHGLAAHQAALVEQPAVLAVELLERVVGQHDGVGPVRDLQQERVAATDHTGGRRDHLARVHRVLERRALRVVDAVREARVDDDGDRGRLVLLEVRAHCLVELLQARQGATLGRKVRSVDDDVLDGHPVCKSTRGTWCTGGCCTRSADMNSATRA